MSDEKKLILEMLSAGKINVSEAEKLFENIDGADAGAAEIFAKSTNRKFLKVLVTEENNTRVNINIPMVLAEVGLKLIPKDKLKIEGTDINIDEILNLIKQGNDGDLVNIDTRDKGKDVKVKIFIE